MAQLNYERRTTRSQMSQETIPAIDWIIPLILLILGASLLFYLVHSPGGSIMTSAIVVAVLAIAYTVIGVVVAFITASLLSFGFGELWIGILKLAGILVFSAALGSLPFGIIFGFVALYALMSWLFEMEAKEVIVFALILRIVTFGISMLLMGMMMS